MPQWSVIGENAAAPVAAPVRLQLRPNRRCRNQGLITRKAPSGEAQRN